MKKEINYQMLANDLISILEEEYDGYRICYELISYGYDYDTLVALGFDYDDIERASRDNMNGVDPT